MLEGAVCLIKVQAHIIIMAGFYGEKEKRKALQLKKLEQIILRAVFNGRFDPTSEAIKLLSAHFGESVPHDGRQLLDFFPEKDRVSFTI